MLSLERSALSSSDCCRQRESSCRAFAHVSPVLVDNRLLVQVIWVLVVRLQQQADGWVSGAASHRTGGVSRVSQVSLGQSAAQNLFSGLCGLQNLLSSSAAGALEQGITLKPCMLCRLWVPGAESCPTEAAAGAAAPGRQEGSRQGPPPERPAGLPAGLPGAPYSACLCRPVSGRPLRYAAQLPMPVSHCFTLIACTCAVHPRMTPCLHSMSPLKNMLCGAITPAWQT